MRSQALVNPPIESRHSAPPPRSPAENLVGSLMRLEHTRTPLSRWLLAPLATKANAKEDDSGLMTHAVTSGGELAHRKHEQCASAKVSVGGHDSDRWISVPTPICLLSEVRACSTSRATPRRWRWPTTPRTSANIEPA